MLTDNSLFLSTVGVFSCTLFLKVEINIKYTVKCTYEEYNKKKNKLIFYFLWYLQKHRRKEQDPDPDPNQNVKDPEHQLIPYNIV